MSEENATPVEENVTDQETAEAPENTALSDLQAKYDRLSVLERYVDALGGADKLIDVANYGYNVRNNPALQAAIEKTLNPQQETNTTPDEDEFYDPEVKTLNGRLSAELAEEKRHRQELESRLARAEMAAITPRLETNIEKAMSFFSGDKDLQTRAAAEIKESLAQTQLAADRGDPQALRMLESLSKPEGVKTLKMMAIDTYEEYVTKVAKKPAEASAKATDERYTNKAAMPPDTVTVRPGKVTADVTRELLEKFTEKAGKDPARLWG